MGGHKKTPQFTKQHAAKYLKRGFDALVKGDFKDASGCAQLVIKYMPKLVEAHFLVGLIAQQSRDWTTARKAFATTIEYDNKHAAAWAQLARVNVMVGRYNQAEDALNKAVEYGSKDPLVIDVIGVVYTLMGHQNKAREWFDKACKKMDNPMFRFNRAKTLVFLGKFKEARDDLENVIKKSPLNTEAHWMLSKLEKANDQLHIDELLELEKKFKPNAPHLMYLYYGLGKEYEDLGEWNKAFQAYENGAKIKRSNVQFNEQEEIDRFKAYEETFTSEWLGNVGEGCDAASPIFIIGQPRTGTTLIERIIVARDDVHSAGELQQFGHAIQRSGEDAKISRRTIETIADADFKNLGETYMDTTRSLRGDTPYFVDKLPVNYQYAPLIAAALPNAKIVHVRRNPMDACFASYKQLFAEAYYHSYDQAEMARHHLRYLKLMDHYRAVLGDRMIEVTYEDVVANMEDEARNLVEKLGLEWQDASLEFHKQKTAVTTASAAQVREKVHNRSVGKWKYFEEQLMEMKNILTQVSS